MCARLIAAAISLLCSASLADAKVNQLDFLNGDWVLLDASGKVVGKSHVEVLLPEAMVYERRSDADGELPVWFVNSEEEGGWIQLFPGPSGALRRFTPQSASGQWPLILGSDVVLTDGRKASFRLTLGRTSVDESHRVLEMSTDGKKSWSPVFDYKYVRAPKN